MAKKKLGIFFPPRPKNHLDINRLQKPIGCMIEEIRQPFLELLRNNDSIELIEELNVQNALVLNGKVYCDGFCLNDLDRFAWYFELDRAPGSFGLEVLSTLARETKVLCDPAKIAIGYDKYQAHLTLLDAGVRVPEFVLFDHRVPEKMAEVMNSWGAAILKPRRGGWGNGVTLINSEARLRDAVGYVRSIAEHTPDKGFFLERYYDNPAEKWASLTMINGQLAQAYRKVMSKFHDMGDGRLKVLDIDEKGGGAVLADLHPSQLEQAHMAAEALGLGLIGFDMIWTEEGPMIIDENTSPGNYPNLYKEEGKDPAKLFADWIVDGI